MQFWGPATLLKKTLTQVLSCEIYTIFKNNYFQQNLWMPTSKLYLKRDSNIGIFLWVLWVIRKLLFCRGSANGWFWNTGVGVSLQWSCKPDSLKAFNSIRKRLQHTNVVKTLGKHFCRTPPSNHFSHDIVFFPFCRLVTFAA